MMSESDGLEVGGWRLEALLLRWVGAPPAAESQSCVGLSLVFVF